MTGCSPTNSSQNAAVDGVAERLNMTTFCSPPLHNDGVGASPVNPASTTTVTLCSGASGDPIHNVREYITQSRSDGLGLDPQPPFYKAGGSELFESGTGLPWHGIQLPCATAARKPITVSAVPNIVQHAEQPVEVEPNPIATEQGHV